MNCSGSHWRGPSALTSPHVEQNNAVDRYVRAVDDHVLLSQHRGLAGCRPDLSMVYTNADATRTARDIEPVHPQGPSCFQGRLDYGAYSDHKDTHARTAASLLLTEPLARFSWISRPDDGFSRHARRY